MHKKAEAGIGTLILFIALILVAAIAAGVIIATAGSLQSRALMTGSKTQTEVATAVHFIRVFGEDTTATSAVSNIYTEITLIPGSDPVSLHDMLLTTTLNDSSQDLTFKNESTCDTAGAIDAGTSQFNVQYLTNASSHKTGYFLPGDTLKICFAASRPITEGEHVDMSIILKTGSIANIRAQVPDVVGSVEVELFP